MRMPFNVGPGELLIVLILAGIMIAVPVLLVLGLFRIASGLRGDPRRILDARLARGEISPTEHQAALRALGR